MIYLVLAGLLAGLAASAQETALPYTLQGTVVDAVSVRPLADVSVSVPAGGYSTVTNADGVFLIKSDRPIRRVVFSRLGYRSQQRTLRGDEPGPLQVRLERASILLDPAQVVSGEPMSLLREALAQIPANFPSEAESFDGFYRETVRKRQRFIYVSEAVVQLDKTSYATRFGLDRAAVRKSRILTSPRPSDTLAVKVLGGPAMAADLDLVKLRGGVLFDQDWPLYRFELLPDAAIDDRMQLVIGMTPAVSTEDALQSARIYIDRETFAFTRIELSLDVSDPERATRSILVRKPPGLRFHPKEMTILLDYKREDSVSRLSYMRIVYRFTCDWRKRLRATDFTAVSEMVATHRHPAGAVAPVSRAEAFHSRDALSDKAPAYADPAFWKDYNIIEPTESLEKAVGRLRTKQTGE